MRAFVWAIVVLLAVSTAGKLIWLASGKFPPRKPWMEASDVVLHGFLIAWAAWVLAA